MAKLDNLQQLHHLLKSHRHPALVDKTLAYIDQISLGNDETAEAGNG